MQLLFLRNGFLALTLIMGSLLTASSGNASQNQSQVSNAPTTNTSDKQQMEHGNGMNHNMTMDLGPADTDFDLRFIDAMTPHHQGAVEMAKETQQKSKRPEIKKLTDDIIKSQNQEITQMQQWRKAWYPDAGDQPMAYSAQMGHTMAMSSDQMKAMMSMDLGAADANFDLRFINAMIPHHQGAVTMAQNALSKSKRPEIKQLAQKIINAQDAEINQMKQWRKAWYKQ